MTHASIGGSFRRDEGLIKAHMERININPNTAYPTDRKDAEDNVRKELHDTIFFHNNDRNRYGQLIRETQSEYGKIWTTT
mmetsp:Transcript_22543/g.21666  ORF Transcript_22543/g.21666 Transcript_22543/m.21666 type:complete len:80 (-) Transcript_22543:1228-1467(-)